MTLISHQGADVAAYLLNDEPDHLYLKMLMVLRAYQGQGIGLSVMDKLKTLAEEQGKPLRLSVFDANPVLGFYTKNDFEIVGRKEGGDILEYAP